MRSTALAEVFFFVTRIPPILAPLARDTSVRALPTASYHSPCPPLAPSLPLPPALSVPLM